MSNDNQKTGLQHIPGVPALWDFAIKTVTTQGLAVFLVFYYLFVMRPEDIERDKLLETALKEVTELRQSVGELKRTIESGVPFVTTDQADKLKSLYRDAVSEELTHMIVEKLEKDISADDLENSIRDVMRPYTKALEGLRQRGAEDQGNGIIANWLTKRIDSDEGICKSIAQEAKDNEWHYLQHIAVSRQLKTIINQSFVLR